MGKASIRAHIPKLHVLVHVGANFSWQVLACAIVVTLSLGGIKLLYSHWRLRKYSAAAEQERQEQAMQGQMSQRHRVSVGHGNGNEEVPFGIRAIESGIEVEGVWISRGNTPELPDSKQTPAASSFSDNVPKKEVSLDREQQASRSKTTSDSTLTAVQPTRTSSDRAGLAKKVPSTSTSRDSSPGAPITKPPRTKYPPVSYSRYSGNPYLLRRPSNTTTTLQALESIYKASTSIRGEDTGSSESSNQSGSIDDSGPISASAPALLTSQPRPRTRQQSSSDLDLLNKHRTSQVAETGQLTPRGRRTGQSLSMDLAGYSGPRRDSASLERPKHFSTRKEGAFPASGAASPPTTPSSPKIEALPVAVRRSSMPDVTPFTEFCKRTSQNGRPESLRSPSRESTQTSTPVSGAQSPLASTPSSPIMPASEGAAEMKLPPPLSKMHFEHRIEQRASQVIRGLGTGFEILRPGSLNPPAVEESTMERQRAMPPVSLQNPARSRRSSTCSTESRKTLQKKRPPSLHSPTGSAKSRWSRISLFS